MNYSFGSLGVSALTVLVAGCGLLTPAPGPKSEPATAAPTEQVASAEATPTAEPKPEAPARKTVDLAEYQLPFSIELGESATQKKLSDSMAKAGFVGAIVYDDPAGVAIGVNTVPAALRTIAGLKADLKKSYKATFLKEEGDLLVYDKTNGGETKEFGFNLRLDVGGTVYVCQSYVPKADTPEKLDASIAACKSLKPTK